MSNLETLINEYLQAKTDVMDCKYKEYPGLEEKESILKNKIEELENYVKNNTILKQVLLLKKVGFI